VERLALGGGGSAGLYTVFRDPEAEERELWGQGQWTLLRRLVEQREPATIGINVSDTHAFADGLSAGEHEQLVRALGPFASRLVRAEALPVEYLSVRLPEMLPTYRGMMRVVHSLIARAFSNEVIAPGTTTDEDVEWWLRDQVETLGYGEWFPPSVSVQRRGRLAESFIAERTPVVIERGDHLHTDFGLTAYGLATDTQHVGYVLQDGESQPPAGLRRALEVSNRLQDIVRERLRPGRTGNEVLATALEAMRLQGIDGSVYTHPIGDHGHGAGPLIGLWDRQDGVPGRGDLPVLPQTWFSIELQATSEVPEWEGQRLRSAQEEDVFVDAAGRVQWVLQRQTSYHLVD
jgi:Xaa-Pro aminopeptidase